MKRAKFTIALALAIASSVAVADMPAQLPPGHPSMEQMNAAATQTSAKGSLTVSLVPGTAGAVAPANEPVTVELYHRNAPVKKYDLTTDAHGKVSIPDLPIMPPVQALISVKHAGLLQQIVSPEMNVAAPTQSLEMKVYESTDAEPAWNVAMQHMILQWDTARKAVHVVEMLATNSPADRAWLGNPTPTGRVTMAIPLPPGASDIELGGGFDEQSTQLLNGKLLTADPLFPGRTEFRISYNIPADNGSAQLVISAPAAVDNLIVFAPADGATLTPTNLLGGDIMDAGQGKVRMFRAQNLAAGATATLTISNLLSSAPLSATPAPTGSDNPLSAKNIAIGGAFLLALVGVGMMLVKKPQAKKA
ncbi:MAG TPA: hypothetical protein VM008_14330 [Phycisphaerae bacterium]|nr:hypothetical protein [Phycisphaerae bacterium]